MFERGIISLMQKQITTVIMQDWYVVVMGKW